VKKAREIISLIGVTFATLFIFAAPLKFGLAEAGVPIPPPKILGEWLFFSYPNSFAYIALGVIGVFAILTAILSGANLFKKESVLFAILGWAVLMLGILIADKHLPPEWKNNNIKLQFLTYGVWFVSVIILFNSLEKKRIALLALLTAGLIVSISAYSQYNGGLEDMRQYAAKEAGFDNFNSYTNYLLTVSKSDSTWLRVRKLAGNRVFATFIYPNALGGFLIILLPICVAMYKSSKEKIVRLIAAVSLFGGAVAMLLSRSKASIVIAALALASIFWLAKRAGRISKMKFISIAVALIICAGGMLFWGYGAGLTGRLKATGAARGDYWKAAAKMIAANPWKGWGTDGFTRNYGVYKRQGAEETRLAHNAFLNVWTDYGITGLAGILIALLLPIIVGWKLQINSQNFDWITVSCIAAGTGFVLHCLVDFDFHIIGITIPALLTLAFGMFTPKSENINS